MTQADGFGAVRRLAAMLAGVMLAACASYSDEPTPEAQRASWEARNVYPENYRAEIMAYMRTYLNDVGNVRDAHVSQPELRPMGLGNRFVSCVRFSPRSAGQPENTDHLVVFVMGKLDAFRDAKGQCASVAYAPFPELEHLAR